MLVDGGRGRKAILRAGMLAFLAFAAIAWGSFVSAYALDKHNLEMPTLFGMTLGHLVPASAALIKESTAVAFTRARSEEPTSELQSLMRISYAVFCLKKKMKI